jgi:two-component system, NarL family, capsular synthesis sensor histidine kinase RcsC
MERFFAASQTSPLEMLRMLEVNLKRERHIFAIAVGLLIFTAVCGAVVTAMLLVGATLRREQTGAQVAAHDVNIAIFNRFTTVTPGGLLLSFNAKESAPPALGPGGKPACQPFPAEHRDATFSRSCEEAWSFISGAQASPGMQFAAWDGTTSYGFNFFDAASTRLPPSARLSAIVDAARAQMAAAGIDPLDAARTRRVMWLHAPAPVGFPRSTILIFMVVAQGGAPYGLVLARLNLNEALDAATLDRQESEVAIFDEQGKVIAGADTESTRFIEQHLRPNASGWTIRHGWGMRLATLDLKVGHVVIALPATRLLLARRGEFAIILLVTAALAGMLLAVHRYWNYRFLTRTYEQTCRAVEGEILNHLLVQATPVALCIALREDFRVLAANQVARAVLGFEGIAARLPASLCEAFEARGIEPPDAGHEAVIERFDYALPGSGDSMLHLKVSYTSAVVNRTHVVFCAMADITEQHEAEQLLRAAKETSEAAARAKLGFFASMSHEIRTPLSSLVGNLELVALGPLSPEQEARVRAMQASASALLHVVNDVLDFSKMNIGELRLHEEWGSIRRLVLRALTGYAPLASRQGLRLFAVIDRECPHRLYFDPIRVTQILNNLLGNALKFTPSGKIVVRVHWREASLELSVADSGIGIRADQCGMLFEPFMQGDTHRLTQARGTGLGLTICEHLARLMQGRIALDSTEGVGTRVTATLPLHADEAHPPGEAAPAGRVAILCRAMEYREWFDNLYDQRNSTLLHLAGVGPPIDTPSCDYLVVTDEFAEHEIDAVWADRSRVLRAMQNGPLVPVSREGGLIEVSIFEPDGFREAVRLVTDRRRDPAGQAAGGAGMPAVKAMREGTPHVLIAEDNRLNRGLLRDQLLTLGASVLEAADGEEALELFRKHRVDLVLTDMDMPKMNGAQVLAAMRELNPAVRVYAVSASASAQDVENGRARGFTDYLTKPVPLAVLAGVLQAHVDDDLPPRLPAVPMAYARDLVQQIDEDIAALEAIYEQRDAGALRRWAHKVSGGLAMLGPSMLIDQCEELRETLRDTGRWVEDVETFVVSIRDGLHDLRERENASLQA